MAAQVAVERRKKVLGTPLKRIEDPRLVRGNGRYLDSVRLPRTAHAAFVRSPYPHAKIVGIDASSASETPGVIALFLGSDLKGVKHLLSAGEKGEGTSAEGGVGKTTTRPALPTTEVNYVGEAVAMVVADDPYTARDAADLVQVEFEPLPAVIDPAMALEPSAPRVHDYLTDNVCARKVHSSGDVEKAFGAADETVRFDLVNQRVAAVPMEPRGVIADYDPASGILTVWSSNQGPHGKRDELSDALGLPTPRVRVRSPDVGGGFGAKLGLHPEDVVVSYASIKLGRPVKWFETRTENLLGTGHGRGQKQHVEVAVRRDGRILGLKTRILYDVGAYGNGTIGMAGNTYMMSTGAYDIPAYLAEVVSVFTNKVPQAPYRGAGRPEATYLIERAMNVISHRLKLDPVAIRRINFIPKESFPYKNAGGLVYDSGDYEMNLRKALEVCDFETLRKEQAKARERGRLVGIGLCTWVEITGFAPGLPQTASVSVTPAGEVVVAAGGLTNGQGHATTFAQIVAEELGIDTESITVSQGDTDSLPWSSVTGGSRSGALTGSAVLLAVIKVKTKMRRIAAHMLGVEDTDLEFDGGKIHHAKDFSKVVGFKDVASLAYQPPSLPKGMDPTIFEYAAFAPPTNVFTFGTHVALAEVDRETGVVTLLKYFAVDDCGKILNPMIVEGQAVGGIVQGIGQALLEEVVYDENGNLLTTTLGDYAIPSFLHMPSITWANTVTPTTANPLGVKGIGEAGATAGTPTVVNAVEDALSQYDLTIEKMPLRPAEVKALIESARSSNRE